MARKKLKAVLERIQLWPESRQDDAVRILIEMEEQDASVYSLTDDQVMEVKRRRANASQKNFSLQEVRKRFDNRKS